MAETNQDFELNLLFKGDKEPIQAFQELGNIFECLHDFDKWMLSLLSNEATIQYSLEDLEYGSIKTRIAQLLRALPDDAIKSLDLKTLVGNYLLKVKYLLLKKLEENKTIDSKAVLESLTSEINSEVKKIDKHFEGIVIREANIYVLINNVESLTKSINALSPAEAIEFKSKFGDVKLTPGVFFNKPKIITELGATTVTNETTEILKIKKIDMLSNEAKWDFKLGSRNVHARILDKKWLDTYHKREIILKPEDSLKVRLKSSYTYTNNNEHTLFQYEIQKVLDVISPDTDKPPRLFS